MADDWTFGTPTVTRRDGSQRSTRSAVSSGEPKKIWKHGPSGVAAVKVTESSAVCQGGEDYGFISDAKLGNIIKGAVSLTAHPNQIRIHGLWTLNPQLLSCIPSTIVTPVSVLNLNLPISGAVILMKEAVGLMATMLAAL